MQQKIQPYLSIGIDIGADFSVMAAALPNQEIIGRTYKILHSSPRSVEGAAERIRSLEQTYPMQCKISSNGGIEISIASSVTRVKSLLEIPFLLRTTEKGAFLLNNS